MIWYRYLLSIRRDDENPAPWRDRLRACTQARLDADGQLYVGARPAGLYQWVSVDEVSAAFEAAPWLDQSTLCPWIGAVEGVLNWEWWEGYLTPDVRLGIAGELARIACGRITRMTDGRSFDLVAQRSFPVRESDSKHGFVDGDFFFSWTNRPGYRAAIGQAISDALASIGLRAELSNVPGSSLQFGTSHNPFRIQSLDSLGGKASPEACWKLLADRGDVPVKLWGFDWPGLDAAAAAGLLTD
jgi:hypothetical protein